MLIATALVLAIGQGATAEVPPDFVVRISYGLCWNESVDTATGRFSRTIRDQVVRRAKLALSPDQRRRLFALVSTVDLFAYPQHFESPGAPMTEPAPDYTVEIRSSGRQHVVQWVDYGGSDAASVGLRAMLRAVREFLVALPSVQRLPASQIVCL